MYPTGHEILFVKTTVVWCIASINIVKLSIISLSYQAIIICICDNCKSTVATAVIIAREYMIISVCNICMHVTYPCSE